MSQPNPLSQALKIPILEINCPYCGREIEVELSPVKVLGRTKQIKTCRSTLTLGNAKEGESNAGCGRDFVLVVEREIKYKTLKIEGEE